MKRINAITRNSRQVAPATIAAANQALRKKGDGSTTIAERLIARGHGNERDLCLARAMAVCGD